MPPSSKDEKYAHELKALAENITFKRIDVPEFEEASFKPGQVRQERTYLRMERGIQAIGRFLIERGTVEILKPEQTLSLFAEIHWCAFQLRALADKKYRSADGARKAVVSARKMVSRIEAAEEELFIANRRLVVSCVKPFFWIGQVWLADFLQEGSKALSNAIRKFDYTRGTPFYAYAQKAIQNRLRNYFRDHVRSGSIGVRPTRDMTKVKNVVEAWVKVHGKEPENEVIGRMTGLTKSRVTQLKNFIAQWEKIPSQPVSLDALLGESTSTLHELVEDVDATQASESAQLAEIWAAMDRLPERSRLIMQYRFLEGHTLEETGNMLGLTRARIKQIQDDSLRKLREMLKEGLYKE